MSLWSLQEICDAVGVAVPPGADGALAIQGVAMDSRLVRAGDFFVALKGTPGGGFASSFASAADGHDYVMDAVKHGAVAVMVDHEIEGVGVPQVVVRETHMEGLWRLGEAARARFSGTLFGLTGSAGKSGTKEFLAAILGSPRSEGSFNNFWGVPLTLARLARDAKAAVVEMGMNQPGEIGRLSRLARPSVALVVNVMPVHLEKLGSLEGIRREKLAIMEGVEEGGKLVVPVGLKVENVRNLEVIRFGEGGDVQVKEVRQGEVWTVVLDVAGEDVAFTLRDGAPHRVANLCAAVAAAWAGGFDVREGVARVAEVGVMEGRGQAEDAGGVMVVDDSFNGNPASMRAALEALKARQIKGRRIALLGDMLELGDEAEAMHAALADACKGVDGVFLVGPLMAALAEKLPQGQLLGHVADEKAFDVAAFAALLRAGDAVVVKASKKIFYVHRVVPRLKEALRQRR